MVVLVLLLPTTKLGQSVFFLTLARLTTMPPSDILSIHTHSHHFEAFFSLPSCEHLTLSLPLVSILSSRLFTTKLTSIVSHERV